MFAQHPLLGQTELYSEQGMVNHAATPFIVQMVNHPYPLLHAWVCMATIEGGDILIQKILYWCPTW